MYGFMGKILWVDLSNGKCTHENLPPEIYQKYLSGSGLAAYVLYKAIPPGADALGPQNVLAFVSGLLTGTGSLFTGRWLAAARSPLTGTWNESNCGGSFSPAIKHCGIDGIFVRGISPKPVYLHVDGEQAELCDAGALWGMDTLETEKILKVRYGERSSTACIGPAGERLSLMASISNESGRQAGRGGMGAVMGSKRLKAVVLQGNARVEVSDLEEVKRLSKKCNDWVKSNIPLPRGRILKYLGTVMRWLRFQVRMDGWVFKAYTMKWGTGGVNQVEVEMGDMPIQNWRGSNVDYHFGLSDATNPDHILKREQRKYKCSACPLGCGGSIQYNGKKMKKPEYETVASWGGLLLNHDLDSIFEMNDLMVRAGIDSISAGTAVAFAIECYEKGLITREDTGGLDLTWGNAQAMRALLDLIISRQGIGDVLADGVKRAAERIGRGSGEWAMHAGGQELGMHDGRYDPGIALHAVVDPIPGRHTSGGQLYYEMYKLWTKIKKLPRPALVFHKDSKYRASPENTSGAVAVSQFNHLLNSTGLCLFGALCGVSRVPVFEWLNAATGWQLTPEAYMETGWRILTLKQMFNHRHGLPLRHAINDRALGKPPLRRGANQERTVDLKAMVPPYWAALEWDEHTGLPTRACLEKLGLNDLIADLNP